MAYQTAKVEELYKAIHGEDAVYEESYFAQTMKLLPPCFSRYGPWLAGGAVRRLCAGEHQDTDFDFFFSSLEQYELFCSHMIERGAEIDHENLFNTTYFYKDRIIQPIKVDIYNTLIQTLNRFDFTICQFGFDGDNVVWSDEAGEDLKSKTLKVVNFHNPIYTLQRAMKYARQGFTLSAPEIKRLLGKVEKDPTLLANARPSPSDKPASVAVKIEDVKADNFEKFFGLN